jgi:hypothetical protein
MGVQDEEGCRWRHEIKHKACLVTEGYVQREGVDFNKVFGPVPLLDSVCVLVAIAARKKWDLQHLDVKSTFLNGDIQKKVYVKKIFLNADLLLLTTARAPNFGRILG